MPAPREVVLDAIVMVVASDGEVTDREIQLALAAARDLPSLRGLDAELDAAMGQAFERFVDEGTVARIDAMRKAVPADDADARLEVLLAATVAAAVDGAPTEDELACIRRMGDAIGATPAEIANVIARAGQ